MIVRLKLAILDYQINQPSRFRTLRKWLIRLGWLSCVGIVLSLLAPSIQQINRSVYPRLAVAVTDETTGKPVPNASVTFDADETELRWAATTDKSGIAELVTEWTAIGIEAGPFYSSRRYSTDGVGILVSASGYVAKKVPISDERKLVIVGFGTEPRFQMSISLKSAATTQPLGK